MEDPTEEKMPFTSHLEELRTRIIRIMIAAAIGFGVCWYFKEWLFQIITKPLHQVLPPNSFMIYTSLPEAFFNYMKISFYASLFLTSPYILYQLWKFISPGLYKTEKKYMLPFVISSTILFICGILFGYYLALPPAFGFFVEFSSDFLKPMLSLREYLSFSLKLLLAFGVSFELPVAIFFLAKIGVVRSRTLSKNRRYAILIIFIAAAILTPSPDALTQIIMAVPLMGLYEIGIIVAKLAEKKSPKAEDLKDDQKEI
ncbi:MAG: twin-arginine translocase subunit TatC [Syntrophales bacterium]